MSSLHFHTLTPKTSRIVAVVTFLLGLAGAAYFCLIISEGHVRGGVVGMAFSAIFVAIGFIGPSSIMLFSDKLSIREGAWKSPKEFPLKEIKEINFTTDKRGRIFTVRTKDATEIFRFGQPGKVVSLFAQQLEALKVRVSGKR